MLRTGISNRTFSSALALCTPPRPNTTTEAAANSSRRPKATFNIAISDWFQVMTGASLRRIQKM
jgi:hypothetical protein